MTKFMSTCFIRSALLVSRDRRHGEAAGEMDRRPQLRHAVDRAAPPPPRRRRSTGAYQRHLRMVAHAEALGLRLESMIGHVADGAGLDQRADDGGPERAGAAGDDDMAIAISPLRRLRDHAHRATQRDACAAWPSCRQRGNAAQGAWPTSISPSSAAASTAPASPATPPAAGSRVLLVEQNDLASGTSSASTKLIHGGLRYLEHGWFRLVREALIEREVLLRMAPHLIRPMRFVLPAEPGLRSPWLILRSGFSSTTISAAARSCRRPAPSISRTRSARRAAQAARSRRGFEYSDCRVDDARLVVLNALDAAERGAVDPHPHALRRAPSAARPGGSCSNVRGRRDVATARVLVNATGPWVGVVRRDGAAAAAAWPRLRLDKGSHIVVRAPVRARSRLHLSDRRRPRRVRAAVRGRFHADRHHRPELSPAIPARSRRAPTRSPISARRSNGYFRDRDHARRRGLVVCRRALALRRRRRAKPQDTTRDYVLALDDEPRAAPLLTVYGGKITTYRRLAEAALDAACAICSARGRPGPRRSHLPGGDFAHDGVERAGRARRGRPGRS